MSNSLDRICTVDISLASPISNDANFDNILILGPAPANPTEDVPAVGVYNSLEELTALGKPLDALPILKRIEGNKTAKKRMEAYVYQLIGRWKDTRGTEYVFREDGSCCIAGKEGYFGGSGYEITVGDEPYPTKGEYSVVSVRGKTVTLRGLQSGRTIRLSYLGEPTDREENADNPEN